MKLSKTFLLSTTFALVVALAGALAAAGAGAATPATVTYHLSTAVDEITANTHNQGFWCTNFGSSDTNDDYFTGNANGFYCNDYFSFSLSGYGNPCTVESAVLDIPRYDGSNTGTKTLGLFDVSTSPSTLAAKHNNPNTTIYNDLGSGTSYGSYSLPTASPGPDFVLSLNAAGLAALQQAKVTHQPYFSIGGSITNQLAGDYFFSSSGGGLVTLTVTVDRLCKAG